MAFRASVQVLLSCSFGQAARLLAAAEKGSSNEVSEASGGRANASGAVTHAPGRHQGRQRPGWALLYGFHPGLQRGLVKHHEPCRLTWGGLAVGGGGA